MSIYALLVCFSLGLCLNVSLVFGLLCAWRPNSIRSGRINRECWQKLESTADSFVNAAKGLQQWYDMDGCSVLLPSQDQPIPRAIVHFLGGFVAGSAAPVVYGKTLTDIADAGYLVVVSPIPALQTNHSSIAMEVATTFSQCYKNRLLPLMGGGNEALQVPIIGLSHSLGGKLTALIHSRKDLRKVLPPRSANVFLAFNNYGFQQSMEMSREQAGQLDPRIEEIVGYANNPRVQSLIAMAKSPSGIGDILYGALGTAAAAAMDSTAAGGKGSMSDIERERFGNAVADRIKTELEGKVEAVSQQVGDKINEALALEFDPSPADTFTTIREGYSVQANVLIRFAEDSIDQSHQLESALNLRGGCDIEIMTVAGTHVTPISVVPDGLAGGDSTRKSGKRKRLGDAAAAAALGMYYEDKDEDEESNLESLVKELLRYLGRLSSSTQASGRWGQKNLPSHV